jgi:hypothetical protein
MSIGDLKNFLEVQAGYAASTQRFVSQEGNEIFGDDSLVSGGYVLTLVLPFTVMYSRTPRNSFLSCRSAMKGGDILDPEIRVEQVVPLLSCSNQLGVGEGVSKFVALAKTRGIDQKDLLTALLTIRRIFEKRYCLRQKSPAIISASISRYLAHRAWRNFLAARCLQAKLRKKLCLDMYSHDKNSIIIQAFVRRYIFRVQWTYVLASVTLKRNVRCVLKRNLWAKCCASRIIQSFARRSSCHRMSTMLSMTRGLQGMFRRILTARHYTAVVESASRLRPLVLHMLRRTCKMTLQASVRRSMGRQRMILMVAGARCLSSACRGLYHHCRHGVLVRAVKTLQSSMRRELRRPVLEAMWIVADARLHRRKTGDSEVLLLLQSRAGALRRFPTNLTAAASAGLALAAEFDKHWSEYDAAQRAIRATMQATACADALRSSGLMGARDSARQACIAAAASLEGSVAVLRSTLAAAVEASGVTGAAPWPRATGTAAAICSAAEAAEAWAAGLGPRFAALAASTEAAIAAAWAELAAAAAASPAECGRTLAAAAATARAEATFCAQGWRAELCGFVAALDSAAASAAAMVHEHGQALAALEVAAGRAALAAARLEVGMTAAQRVDELAAELKDAAKSVRQARRDQRMQDMVLKNLEEGSDGEDEDEAGVGGGGPPRESALADARALAQASKRAVQAAAGRQRRLFAEAAAIAAEHVRAPPRG